jgi:hypothetical protein
MVTGGAGPDRAAAGQPGRRQLHAGAGASSALFPRQDADARPLAVAASPVGRVVVEAHANGVPADGQSVVRLTLRLFGRDGRPLADATSVTLEHSGGRLRLPGARTDEFGPRAQDADRAQPGVQLIVRQGVAEVELIAPAEAQDVRVRVSAGGEAARGRDRLRARPAADDRRRPAGRRRQLPPPRRAGTGAPRRRLRAGDHGLVARLQRRQATAPRRAPRSS